jgi:phage shock protein C
MSISRPREARMIAGVCAALARRYGMPLFLLRVLTVAAGIAGFGLIVYAPTSLERSGDRGRHRHRRHGYGLRRLRRTLARRRSENQWKVPNPSLGGGPFIAVESMASHADLAGRRDIYVAAFLWRRDRRHRHKSVHISASRAARND